MSEPSISGDKAVAWARVYAAVSRAHSKILRHGTWYPVVADDQPDRVSLQVGAGRVDVPRALLEIRQKRPMYFSVVRRTRESVPRAPSGSVGGKFYLVCPDCDHRNTFFGHPDSTRCQHCKFEGDIAWWDS